MREKSKTLLFIDESPLKTSHIRQELDSIFQLSSYKQMLRHVPSSDVSSTLQPSSNILQLSPNWVGWETSKIIKSSYYVLSNDSLFLVGMVRDKIPFFWGSLHDGTDHHLYVYNREHNMSFMSQKMFTTFLQLVTTTSSSIVNMDSQTCQDLNSIWGLLGFHKIISKTGASLTPGFLNGFMDVKIPNWMFSSTVSIHEMWYIASIKTMCLVYQFNKAEFGKSIMIATSCANENIHHIQDISSVYQSQLLFNQLIKHGIAFDLDSLQTTVTKFNFKDLDIKKEEERCVIKFSPY